MYNTRSCPHLQNSTLKSLTWYCSLCLRVVLCVSDAPACLQLYMQHVLKVRYNIQIDTHDNMHTGFHDNWQGLSRSSADACSTSSQPAHRSCLSTGWHGDCDNKPCVNLLHSASTRCQSKGKQFASTERPEQGDCPGMCVPDGSNPRAGTQLLQT